MKNVSLSHHEQQDRSLSRMMWTYLGWSLVVTLCILILALQLGVSYRIFKLRTDMSIFNHSLAVCFATSGALNIWPLASPLLTGVCSVIKVVLHIRLLGLQDEKERELPCTMLVVVSLFLSEGCNFNLVANQVKKKRIHVAMKEVIKMHCISIQ